MTKLDLKSGHKGFIVICILGFVLLGLAIFFLVSTKNKLDNWTHTDATVTGYESDYRRNDDGDYETMYQEIVEYTVNGKTYTATNSSSSNIKPSIGSIRKIAYDPSSPENCLFVADSNIVIILLFVLSTVFILAGISLFLRSCIVKQQTYQPEQAEETKEDDEFKFDRY